MMRRCGTSCSVGASTLFGRIIRWRVWYDGTTAYFAVSQALNAVPFVMQSAAIASGTPTQIQITFDRALNASIVPAASAFAITNSGGTDTVSAVAISGSTVTLTKSRTTLSGDTVSVAYTAPGSNPITDGNGNVAGSSSIAVTNNVASASTNYLRLTTHPNTIVEAAHSGGGYDYTTTTATYGPETIAYPASQLPSSTDGWAACTILASNAIGPIVGLCSNLSPTSFSDITLGLYADNANDSNNWTVLINGSNGGGNPATTKVQIAANDVARVRRAGSTGYCEVSKDGGNSWTAIYSATITTAALRPLFLTGATGSSGAIVQPRGSASVA